MLSVRKYHVIAIILSLYTITTSVAQIRQMDFEEMWVMTMEHNLDIRNAGLQIEQYEDMRKSSWDPGMTQFRWERGQINGDPIDNMYVVEQNLGSPFEMSATNKYYESETDLWKINESRVIRETKKSLRKYYYSWIYENERLRIIEKGLDLFRKASEFSALQYETGESNLLSKALIDSKWQEMNISSDRIKVNKSSLINQINVIIQSQERIEPSQQNLQKLVILFPEDQDRMPLDSLPDIALEQQRFQVAQSYLGMTKSRISPYFSAGYFNQQLLQESGFQGFLIGIEFPLWFFPQKARVQAASVNQSIAENRYFHEKNRVENEFENLRMRYDQLILNIRFYEEQRLENARQIEENANLLYETGEIGYLEFVQNLTTALQIQEDYWTLVNEYNQLVIEMYYYLDI
jgi:cobalt-zinc-cadmium resistance protein CzcA